MFRQESTGGSGTPNGGHEQGTKVRMTSMTARKQAAVCFWSKKGEAESGAEESGGTGRAGFGLKSGFGF